MRSFGATLLAGLALGVAAPACAADVTPTDHVRILVSADVVGRCGFDQQLVSSATSYDIAAAQSHDYAFQMNCNTPFEVRVKSDNGAMAFDGSHPNDGFAYAKPYTVGLSINTDQGVLNPPDCDASQLKAGIGDASTCAFYGESAHHGLSSGTAISIGDPAKLTVSWTAVAAGPRPAAGNYKDTITVVVAPRS